MFGVSYFDISLNRRVWVGADPHIGHKNLVRKGLRPEGFDEDFLSWWRGNVSDDDYVFILGDWCLTSWKRCRVDDLPGLVKVLVRGNHDGLKSVFKYGFDYITDYALVRVWLKSGVAQWVLLSHKRYPHKYWGELPRKIVCNIHGHSHQNRPLFDRSGRYINADIAYFGYGLEDLRALIWRAAKGL